MLGKSLALAALLGVSAATAAIAQQPFQPNHYPLSPAQALPPSWSYDPYTSGLGPCPQRRPGDEPCRNTVFPTYGQPDYWGAR